MTKDSHFQITANPNANECVTPNVPRIRASFFNRKYRDISGGSDGHTQLTPSTPKVNTSRTRNSSTTKSRSRRSGAGSSGSARVKTRSPNYGRPGRSRPDTYEFDDQEDFSTPRASRTLITPPKTSARVSKNGRISHVIYKPLELDNESSSEPTESYKQIHCRPKWCGSPSDQSPLAIEAPHAEVTLTILDQPADAKDKTTPVKEETPVEDSKPKKKTVTPVAPPPKKQEQQQVIETICISDSEDEVTISNEEEVNKSDSKKRKCEPTTTQDEIRICSPVKRSKRTLDNGSTYMSQPDTPPDDDHVVEEKPAVKLSKFVPGNCNIDDILSLCSKEDKNEDIKNKSKKLKSSAEKAKVDIEIK